MADENDTLEKLLEPSGAPAKTYTQLVVEGVPHKGGLADLAAAEQMEDPGPQLAALRAGYLATAGKKAG